ncbi:MAG: flagellar hook-length control protein FliK [Lachnospiraceae bacterium]|nr:flagellar hook-length control protein FliK [Lachnospiraceae bacterium]
MKGASMNQMLHLMQESIQTQKGNAVKALAKEAAKAGDFSEYMKMNTIKSTEIKPVASASSTKVQTSMEQTQAFNRESSQNTVSCGKEQNIQKDTPISENTQTEKVKTAEDVSKAENTQTHSTTTEETNQTQTEESTETADVIQEQGDKETKTALQEHEIQEKGTEFGEQQEEPLEVKTITFGDILVSLEYTTKTVESADDETADNLQNKGQLLHICIEVPEEMKAVFDKVETQLVDKIAEVFQVSEEEVVEAMETLAVNLWNLLQPDNLKELAVAISQEESVVSLVTNEEFLESYQQMETGIREILAGLSEEETAVLEELDSVFQQTEQMAAELTGKQEISKTHQEEQLLMNVKTEITVQQPMTEQSVRNLADGQPNSEDIPMVVVAKETILESVTTEQYPSDVDTPQYPSDVDTPQQQNNVDIAQQQDNVNVPQQQEVSVENPLRQEKSVDNSMRNPESADNGLQVNETQNLQLEENSKTDRNRQNTDSEQQKNSESQPEKKEQSTPIVQSTTSFTTVTADNQMQTIVRTEHVDYEGIVRQIVEQVKVEIKPDTVSMELQLNPESLGKVNLHISSREGAVTAELFVQNEAVKNAIEGQLMVLRETMQQQGIKVEAVEVTVETGQSDRNLEQHSEEQKRQAEDQSRGYRRKAINLLQGLDEEFMDEDDLIRAHIMQESGNSVDMNA